LAIAWARVDKLEFYIQPLSKGAALGVFELDLATIP
jgi:hypothetical protein